MQILNLGTVDFSAQLPSDLNVTERHLEILQMKLALFIDAELYNAVSNFPINIKFSPVKTLRLAKCIEIYVVLAVCSIWFKVQPCVCEINAVFTLGNHDLFAVTQLVAI